jgi:hypothetical protein
MLIEVAREELGMMPSPNIKAQIMNRFNMTQRSCAWRGRNSFASHLTVE